MTTIESKTAAIAVPAVTLFHFLSDFNNFQHLMPSQVRNWQSTENTCSFNIEGLTDVELELTEKIPYESLKIAAMGVTPLGLNMTWRFSENGTVTDTRLILDADLNPVMAMMAKAPLNNFVNLLVDKLKELAEKGLIS